MARVDPVLSRVKERMQRSEQHTAPSGWEGVDTEVERAALAWRIYFIQHNHPNTTLRHLGPLIRRRRPRGSQ